MSYVFARSAGLAALGWCLAVAAQAQASGASAEAPSGQASGQSAESSAEAPEEERRLDIFNYRVEGNTVLSRSEVETAVMPYLGPQRKVSDVEAARVALIAAYHARGFETVDVQIPDQDGRGGVVRFQVSEYKVGRLRVTGSRHFSPEDIRKGVPSLAEGQVPNYKAVSADIASVNKSADRLITPTLRAGDTPGTVDVDLNVEDKLPLHGSFEINDRASGRTKRARIAASIGYNNLFQRGHSLNLQVQAVPEQLDQSLVVSASYVAPVAGTPFTAVAYAVHSDSDVAALGDINVLGSGKIFGLRGIFSEVTGEGEGAWVHQVTAGADYKDFEESLSFAGKSDKTPIDYGMVTLQYSLSQRTQTHDVDFGVGLSAGLRNTGSSNEVYSYKRYGAKANWVTLRGDAGYTHRYKGDWQVSGRLSAQYAGKPVISNEQFSAGGLDSVRGYYEGQFLGDDGASAQVQIDFPSFHKWLGNWSNEARMFVFADGAALRTYLPLGEQKTSEKLASLGGGLKLRAFTRFNASVVLAAPQVGAGNTLIDIGDDVRVHARVWTEF